MSSCCMCIGFLWNVTVMVDLLLSALGNKGFCNHLYSACHLVFYEFNVTCFQNVDTKDDLIQFKPPPCGCYMILDVNIPMHIYKLLFLQYP